MSANDLQLVLSRKSPECFLGFAGGNCGERGTMKAKWGGKPTAECSVTEMFPEHNYNFFKAVKQKPKG